MPHSPNPPLSPVEKTIGEIENRFGLVPNFFRLTDDAEIASELWRAVQMDYLDAPFPSLFKEQLFVYLSKFCSSPYCASRHAGFLLGDGFASADCEVRKMSSEEVLSLLSCEPKTLDELRPALDKLGAVMLPANEWRPEFEADLIACFACIFRKDPGYRQVVSALSHYLGSYRFDRMIKFLAFVRTAHLWTETHPSLEIEPELRELFVEEKELAGWFADNFEKGITEPRDWVAPLDEHLRELFDNTSDLIQSIDFQGRFVFVNQAWLDTLEYSFEELRTMDVFDVIHPSSAEEFGKVMEKLRDGVEPGLVEATFVAKSGREIAVEGNISIRSQNGKPVAMRGFFRDITERNRVSSEMERLVDQLKTAMAQVDALTRLLPVCSWCDSIRDEEGSWVTVNQFLKQHQDIQITHGICPNCATCEFPEEK